MNKNKIIKLISISIAVIAIAIIFPLNLTYGSFNKTANLIMTKEYNLKDEININTIDSNIEIINTDINNIKVSIYDRSDKDLELKEIDNKLNITNKKQCKNCEKSKVVIMIPNNYEGKFNLITESGNINVDNVNDLKLTTKSGNVIINNIETFKGKTDSGNLAIESLNNNIDFKTTTGEVNITNANIRSESNIETTTGKIGIEKINNIRVKVTSFNSQASVKTNKLSNIILNVATYNGLIEIK